MKTYLLTLLCFLFAVSWSVGAPPSGKRGDAPSARKNPAASDVPVDAHPKLLRISGRIDGSGRMVFTRESVKYAHKHWAPPSRMLFDGEPWTNLGRTPAPWRDFGDRVDLTNMVEVPSLATKIEIKPETENR